MASKLVPRGGARASRASVHVVFRGSILTLPLLGIMMPACGLR
jgi:hypothetical protein